MLQRTAVGMKLFRPEIGKKLSQHIPENITRWWFQRFFIFTPIWGRFPICLIFLRWVETTNQIRVDTPSDGSVGSFGSVEHGLWDSMERTTCLEERGAKKHTSFFSVFFEPWKNFYESTSGLGFVFFSVTLHVFLQAFEGKVYLPGNSFCDIFGMVKCLFQGFCDLQLGGSKRSRLESSGTCH